MSTQTLAQRLQQVRLTCNLSRNEFVSKIDANLSTYGNYERGSRVPGADLVEKVCNTFNISPTWLITGQGPVHMPENPSGLETKLLEKIIAKVEEHLDDKKSKINPGKKAEVISILYEEAVERDDQREQPELDWKVKRFINLLVE